MTIPLRQSTAVDVLIGPFVDSTNGYDAETGVSPSVKLSKNGQALAAKNDATTPVHDSDGYYNCEFDTTDTDTVGSLVAIVPGSATHLPVRHEFVVLDEVSYDALYASAATLLTDKDVGLIYKGTVTTVNSQTSFVCDTNIANNNSWVGNVAVIEDVTGDSRFATHVSSSTASTDTVVLNSAATFTAAVGDIIRVYGWKAPGYEIDDYAPSTAAALTSHADDVLAYVQLLARKDSAIATDRASELAAINADEGTGSGAYAPTTESQEAIGDRLPTALSAGGYMKGAVITVNGRIITGLGTDADPFQGGAAE